MTLNIKIVEIENTREPIYFQRCLDAEYDNLKRLDTTISKLKKDDPKIKVLKERRSRLYKTLFLYR